MTDHADTYLGLKSGEVESLRKEYGYNEIEEKKQNYFLLFLSKFWGLSAWMLEFISILSFILHKISDTYIVVSLLLLNAVIGYIQEKNAARAVDLLKKKLEINVRVLRNAAWNKVPARELVPGDIVRMRSGDFVPADLQVAEGEIHIDQSALTGESGSIRKQPKEAVYSGSVVMRGEATCRVTTTGKETFFGKTVQLVQTAKPQSHIGKTISRVTTWLLAIVGALLLITFIIAVCENKNLLEILPLMLVLLLGAIPVALTAMFTVSMALGSKELIKQGVLVTRLNAPDDAAAMEILCVDKTGTLTTNKLSVAEVIPAENRNQDEVLLYGVLASREANNDAIDAAFILKAKEKGITNASFELKSFIPFDPERRSTQAVIKKGEEEFVVMKGSFHSIARECNLDSKELQGYELRIDKLAASGYRTLAVAKGKAGERPGFIGLVALHDPPREDSENLIREIEDMGVSVRMLTGDAVPTAREIAREVKIGDKILRSSGLRDNAQEQIAELIWQSNGVAEVYPEDKFNIVRALQSRGLIVGMTGDGVNDAPALKQAEVGIAVSNATDVAKGAASIILTQEGLVNILAPIRVGRMMFERINTWVLNKIARTTLKTIFVVCAFLVFGKFVISATAMLLMIFMTDFVKISLSTDHVTWERTPAKWNIRRLAGTGILIGFLMFIETFTLLYIGWTYFGLQDQEDALSTFCFEILLYFGLFSIFIVREKGHFWQSAPSKILLGLIFADMILGFIISTFGLLGFQDIPVFLSIFIIIYALVCSFLVNDLVKFFLLRRPKPRIL